ncbi:NTP transferase domain-containing protein [Parapedomonas caeni]
MRFGTVDVAEAVGAILAHGITVAGRRLPKGTVIDAPTRAWLRDSGVATLVVALPDPGDVAEDVAAARLAALLSGPGARPAKAIHGRCNIHATVDGVAELDVTAIGRINLLDEAMTVATVPPFMPVRAGALLATVKIIPFAVAGDVFARLAACLPDQAAIGLRPFRPGVAHFIQTALPAQKESLFAKAERVTRARMDALGWTLSACPPIAHDSAALTGELRRVTAVAAPDDMILILGATATADRRDVIPAAIVAAGGRIERLGMPVDPGNLLCLGVLAGRPVVGLPGCARSPKLNGADWVLSRLATGLSVTGADIAAMGVGGLIDDVAERPEPRGSTVDMAGDADGIGAVVLAAGQSRRMGELNKLLADLGGQPMIRRVCATVRAALGQRPVVVVGHEAEAVRAALAGLDVDVVDNPAYATGMSSSVRAGIQAVSDRYDAVFICLGDMPEVSVESLRALAAAFDPAAGRDIVVPTLQGRRGNPVLWGRPHFARLKLLEGDAGARDLLELLAPHVAMVEIGRREIVDDVDTPDDLAALRVRQSAP